MADTLTAPAAAPVAPVTPVALPVTAPTIQEAGDTFRKAASWNDVGLPAPVVDDPTPADAPAGGDPKPAGDPPPTDDGPEFVQNAQGQWHRPDGTFADAEQIAAIEAQIAADAAAAPKPVDAPVAPAPVTLRRRDGTTREVQVDDPELAEEIRTNFNDGMRRKDFTEKVASVEARAAQYRQLDAMLDKNPEAFVYQSLSDEQRIRLATMLLAQDFDKLVPIIQDYDQNPQSRITATAESARRMREQETEFQTFTSAQKAASDVRAAVETLIPDTLDPSIAEQFWADASSDLQRAIARGDQVTPDRVPALLANRLKLYGITVAGSPAPALPRISVFAPNASASPSPVAAPVGDAALALADVKAKQNRIRLQQTNRANAAAVPPAGAGAAPVRLPPVPAGATIEEASKALKKHRAWAS